MRRNVGERWEEYLRLGRRTSSHTVAAYLGDFHSLMKFLSLGTDATPDQLREALTQRAVRSWLARTLATPPQFATSQRGRRVKGSWRAIPRRCYRPRAATSVCRHRSTNPMRGRFSMLRGTRLRREEPPRFVIGRSSNSRMPAGFASPKSVRSTSHL